MSGGDGMYTWKPVRGTVVVFAIKAGEAAKQPEVMCTNFLEPFGLKYSRFGDQKIRVDDPRWPQLLEKLEAATKGQRVHLDVCWLEEPKPKASDPHAWFEFCNSSTVEFRSAARAPKGAHLLTKEYSRVASPRFVEIVRSAGLTGLGVLPLADSGADDPTAWFEVYAERPIGRGVDHPLVDSAKHLRRRSKDKLPPERRWGESTAWWEDRRDCIADDEVVRRLLELIMRPELFRVQGPERFVREHLPQTDFAYMGWGFEKDKKAGAEGRPLRMLCCNATARAALIDAGVMKPSHFEVLATTPASELEAMGVTILDRTVPGPIPPPIYTPEEAEVERARREEAIAKRSGGKATAAHRVFTSIDEAITELEQRIRDGSAKWTPAENEDDFEAIRTAKLFKKTPKAWQRVVHLLPMDVYASGEDEDEDNEGDDEFDFVLAEPEWNDWLSHDDDDERDEEEQPSKDDLVIARTPNGDWYAVRKGDPLLPEDGRVVHWDHETTTIKDEWPNVAAFVSAIIEACDRAANEG